jgi:glutathione-specific gamma-glutamylcyclotransferase
LTTAPRQMRLTEQHVALMQRDIPDTGPAPGMVPSTDEDYAQYIADILAEEPSVSETWIFAYGSLIWKPACDTVEQRVGIIRGWHRAFCLGWTTRWRATEDNPGLMLALDHGGSCRGVLYRLPPDAVEPNLKKLFEREMGYKPSPFPPRWVNVETERGAMRAITFCIDRKSGRYVSGLSEEQIADVLARATGSRGSMAEYLHSTVSHLEELGIRDHHLWRLQELVADRIDAAYGPHQNA